MRQHILCMCMCCILCSEVGRATDLPAKDTTYTYTYTPYAAASPKHII